MEAAIVVGIIIAVVGTIITLSVIAEKNRKAKITQMFTQLGGVVSFQPTAGDRSNAYAVVPYLRTLPDSQTGVAMVGSAVVDKAPVNIISHTYSTGAGKSRQTHRNTIACIPCSPHWPALSLSPETLIHRLTGLGSKDIQLDNPVFNKAWRVRTDSEDFAVLALTPAVQEWLVTHGPGYTWHIGQGAICVVTQRHVDADQLRALLQLPVVFYRTLPPEIAQYS